MQLDSCDYLFLVVNPESVVSSDHTFFLGKFLAMPNEELGRSTINSGTLMGSRTCNEASYNYRIVDCLY